MKFDQEELERLSGYKRPSDLMRWVKKCHNLKLLAPGKEGRISAIFVESGKKKAGPNYERLTEASSR